MEQQPMVVEAVAQGALKLKTREQVETKDQLTVGVIEISPSGLGPLRNLQPRPKRTNS